MIGEFYIPFVVDDDLTVYGMKIYEREIWNCSTG